VKIINSINPCTEDAKNTQVAAPSVSPAELQRAMSNEFVRRDEQKEYIFSIYFKCGE
jgi:hypothetical protein